MKFSKGVVSSLLILTIVLFLGMLFWPFVVNNIIQPIGLVVWLFLRILVLGIHQKYFWYAVILIAFIALVRLLPEAQSDIPAHAYVEKNTTIANIEYWRGLFMYSGRDSQDEKILKRRLTYLLTTLYASKLGTSNDFRLREALEQGRISLPRNVHTFLFPEEPQESGGPLRKFFQSIRKTPQKWIRQWTGQEKAEHCQMIEEVLNFMETSLEIKNDDRKLSQNKH